MKARAHSLSQAAGLSLVATGLLAAVPSVDPAFDPGVGPDDTVWAIAEDAKGRVLIGGEFVTVAGRPRTRVARLGTDGRVDTTFEVGLTRSVGVGAIVTSVVPLPDGRVWIAGGFDRVNGEPVTGVALLSEDGSLDPGFLPLSIGSPFQPPMVYHMAGLPDGSLLIAGEFSTVEGEPRSRVARLDTYGMLDRNFRTEGLEAVIAIRPLPDGRVLTFGMPVTRSSQPMPGQQVLHGSIRRLNRDGSIDNTFLPDQVGYAGMAFDGWARPDGSVVSVMDDSVTGRSLLEWDRTGRLLREFPGGTSGSSCQPACPMPVFPVLGLPDGGAWVGGSFHGYLGRPWVGLARIARDGTPVDGFDPGAGISGPDARVTTFCLAKSGALYVAGDFEAYDGVPRRRVLRLSAPPSTAPSVTGQSGNVAALDGSEAQLWVEAKGQPWPTFQWEREGQPVAGATGQVLVVESATAARAGTYRCRLSNSAGQVLSGPMTLRVKPRQPGFVDPAFHAGLPPSGTNETTAASHVRVVLPQPDGRVVIGGRFNEFNGLPRTGLARLNPDGSVDPSFAPILAALTPMGETRVGMVYALAPAPEGRVLVVGDFARVNGTPRRGLARLNPDGSLDTGFVPAVVPLFDDMSLRSSQLAVDGQGRLVLAAWFKEDEMLPAEPDIVRLLPNGALDSGFRTPRRWMNAMAGDLFGTVRIGPDNSVWVGGNFTYEMPPGGGPVPVSYRNVIHLRTDGTPDPAFMASIGSTVRDVEPLAGGLVLVAGDFRMVDDTVVPLLARLLPSGRLDTSFRIPAFDQADTLGSSLRRVRRQPDGRIVAGGLVRLPPPPGQMFAGFNLNRLLPDGATDPEFDAGRNFQLVDSMGGISDEFMMSVPLRDMAFDAQGGLVVAGDFELIDQWERPAVARVDLGRAVPDRPDLLEVPVATYRRDMGRLRLAVHAYGHPRPAVRWLLDGKAGLLRDQPLFDDYMLPPGIGTIAAAVSNAGGQAGWGPIPVKPFMEGTAEIAVQDGRVRVMMKGMSGRKAWLEYKDSLAAPTWTRLPAGDTIPSEFGLTSLWLEPVAVLVDCPPPGVTRFYRVVVP